ncbi:hypothetical protein Daura_31615 [Dactylosporangium aurantiacum]|uniref:Uncharacterized protein n=1 Tax=Dactylosporangium aurantiacum TaxID=35754 RepID=A0A9Q9IA91_9ACTN|nr:hypothetical protein [Dactylosporangium aurantiacum]MDG6109552.1 hypothetical protein [Dactylosporangium aurantiacum]UWZ51291.1 hypothetical protein Daura_31615 [Dactylosporangium aurantiacum]
MSHLGFEDDDTAGGELRALMLAVDVPASGADLHRAITAGRRARRRSALTGATAGVAVLAAVGTFVAFGPMRAGPSRVEGPPASAAPVPSPSGGASASAGPLPALSSRPLTDAKGAVVTCRSTALALPAGAVDGFTTSIDPTGRLVGGHAGNGSRTPVIWRDGRPEVVPGVTGQVQDVASDGTAVGFSGDEDAKGWLVRGGKVTVLALPPGYRTATPAAVNASGVAVGLVGTGQGAFDGVPARWSADGTVHLLTIPAGIGRPELGSDAQDIADDGTVVGTANGVAMRWSPDGTPHPLAVAVSGNSNSRAQSIAGRYAFGVENGAAVRWDLQTGQAVVLRQSGAFSSRGGTPGGRAIVSSDGSVPSVLVAEGGAAVALEGPNRETGSLTGMSLDGRIIAGNLTSGATNQAVTWTCGA